MARLQDDNSELEFIDDTTETQFTDDLGNVTFGADIIIPDVLPLFPPVLLLRLRLHAGPPLAAPTGLTGVQTV